MHPAITAATFQSIPRNTGLISVLLWLAYAALRRGRPAPTRARSRAVSLLRRFRKGPV